MKNKCVLILTCIVLALVMAAEPLMVAYSEGTGTQEYLCDLKVGYGDSGKQKLLDAGYKVYAQNVNENGDGDDVWIGYKTSFNKKDAITDVTTMNMNGSYSFDKYEQYINDFKASATELANSFMDIILELKANYNKEKYFAKEAINLLNVYYDDETEMNFGDLILSDKYSEGKLKEIITHIFFYGNTDILDVVYLLLNIGITEDQSDNFVKRLEQVEYTGELDVTKNLERGILYNMILDVRDDIKATAEYGEEAKKYMEIDEENGLATYLNKFEEAKQAEVIGYVSTYLAYTSVQFGTELVYIDFETEEEKNLTLFDVLTLPTEEEWEELFVAERNCGDWYLDQYLVEILRQSMTTGQLKLAQMRGLDTVISYAFCGCGDNSLADIQSEIDSAKEQLKDITNISLYEGVDISLLDDYKDVALTGSAVEEINKGGSVSLAAKTYQKAETMKKVSKILAIVGGTTSVIGTVTFFVGKALKQAITNRVFQLMELAEKNGIQTTFEEAFKTYLSMASTSSQLKYQLAQVFNVLGPILFVIGIVMMIASLVVYLARPTEIPNITYTKIPRALVHQVEDLNKKYTYNYYAVKLIDAVDNKDDYMNVYGDLNGKGGKVQWLVLYYTKDTRVGTPLSGNAKFSIGADNANLNYQNNYIPVHGFELDTATNLNNLNFGSGIKGIYMYMEQVTETPLTGSLFSGNQVATSISCALGGAVIAFLATFFAMRKKKKEV